MVSWQPRLCRYQPTRLAVLTELVFAAYNPTQPHRQSMSGRLQASYLVPSVKPSYIRWQPYGLLVRPPIGASRPGSHYLGTFGKYRYKSNQAAWQKAVCATVHVSHISNWAMVKSDAHASKGIPAHCMSSFVTSSAAPKYLRAAGNE